MQTYLLRCLVFAVAGRGEAKRVSVWECVCAGGASLWQDGAAGPGAGASAEEPSTRWLLAPAPALPAGSAWSTKTWPSHFRQIRAGPAPSRPEERKQPPFVPACLPLPALGRRRACPKGWGLRRGRQAGGGRLAQRGCWMRPPRREGPARLPQCLPTGLFPDRLVLKSGTRAAECKYKEMTGEEQLTALWLPPLWQRAFVSWPGA